MRFYSGFSLEGEQSFFTPYLADTSYTVAGFSYGAIKALKDVLASHQRVDRLQLLSPAFFQEREEKFRRLQLMGHKRDRSTYIKTFIQGCFRPYAVASGLSFVETTVEELEELLYYVWEPKSLEKIASRGTRIEVYLGGEDQVVDAEAARHFFKAYADVYLIKRANHFLMEKE